LNERERLLCVLNKQRPDRIPWFADLSYLYHSLEKRDMLIDRYIGDEGYLEFHKDLGAGICFYAPCLWKTEYTNGVEYIESTEENVRICMYKTPMGEIRSVEKYMQGSFSWAYTKHFVEDINDLRIMLYVFENTRYSNNYEEFDSIDAFWDGSGIPAALTPVSAAPLQKLLTRWAGIEAAVNIYMDDMQEFDHILRRMEETEDDVFDIICKSDASYVEFAENLSSEITGKDLVMNYNMPYYIKRTRQIHEAGKFAGIHIDGTLRSCLPLLERCGFDVAEAVTPYPAGDLKLHELREAAGKDIVIWGGLPGVIFTDRFSENDFLRYLNEVLETFSNDPGFVLGVADQVPPDGSISRVKAVREYVDSVCLI